MEKKLQVSKTMVAIIFFISFFYSILTKIFLLPNSIDNIKYILFSVTILLSVKYIYQNRIEVKLKKEIFFIIVLLALILISSLITCIYHGNFISMRTFIEIIYILLPVTCAFCIVNIYSIKEIISIIKLILILSLFFYFIELLTFNITFSDIMNINFISSYSPFESYIFADISVFCFCFFSYYKNKKIDSDFLISVNYCYYISFIFVLFTFKRVLVIFSLILFILNFFKYQDILVPKAISIILMIFIFVATITYTWLLSGDNAEIVTKLFSLNLDKLTVGRQWYFSIIENNLNLLNGYGSTTDILTGILGQGKYLEMDLVKIYIETGPIILAVFIYVYWKQIYNNLFSLIVYLFLFVNMLFSHSLTTFYAWILFFLLFYSIKLNNNKKGDAE